MANFGPGVAARPSLYRPRHFSKGDHRHETSIPIVVSSELGLASAPRRTLYLSRARMKSLVVTHNRKAITAGNDYPMYGAFQRLWALHGTACRYALDIPAEKLLTRPTDGVWPKPLIPLAVISPAWGLWALRAVLSPLDKGESEADGIAHYARWGVRFIGLSSEQLDWPYLNSVLFARRLRQAL